MKWRCNGQLKEFEGQLMERCMRIDEERMRCWRRVVRACKIGRRWVLGEEIIKMEGCSREDGELVS